MRKRQDSANAKYVPFRMVLLHLHGRSRTGLVVIGRICQAEAIRPATRAPSSAK